jgi:hypothetical protein
VFQDFQTAIVIVIIALLNHVKIHVKAFHIVIIYKSAQAHDPNSCGYSVFDESGRWKEGVYTRVHRDIEIINAMREWMGLYKVSNNELGLSNKCWSELKFMIE